MIIKAQRNFKIFLWPHLQFLKKICTIKSEGGRSFEYYRPFRQDATQKKEGRNDTKKI
jgi:hypothetical protein